MTEEFQLNDDTYTGTKEVSENLKFESKLLKKLSNLRAGSQIQHIKFRLKIMLMF